MNFLVIILFVISLVSPLVNFAQAINPGTTVNFVLFSTNGAVSNTGISQLTGNVGTNSGSSTGFGNVNGVMHDNDGTSSTCANDLFTLYNQLNSAIPTFFPSSAIGNGDTLNAGVYKIAANATLSSTLTLNAQGNANAVFIFQIQAAFSTNPSSKVKLINGAQACNVFWKVEGLVSMATATFMRGTVIANNAAITMATNDTLEGRALSTTGAITTDGVLAYTPTGCGSVLLTGPTAPYLATASCFAIFSGNGSVTNSGITRVSGDVGTNVGLTTGYDPLLVNGMIHPIPDGATSACASDLLNAYNYLNTLPFQIQLLYPAQFGNNLVLTPHTYLMNAATSFTGKVYLNAQGNPDAVFVIKINGALTTSTYSKVIMINGTQAKNVYWMVNGAVTINDYSVFNGTIVCNNGALNLNTGDSLNGRALTTNGALSTSAIVASIPAGSCSPLPVTWLYFRGKADKKNVMLEWATSNEINNGFFTIEKSHDGISFETLGIINSGGQIINSVHHYSIIDPQPYSVTFYRISQTDIDGHKRYFQTIEVRMGSNNELNVTHFTRDHLIYVQTSGAVPGNGYLELYSVDGKKVAAREILLTREPQLYQIPAPNQKGIYVLSIYGNGGKLYGDKVIVQ